MEKYIISFSTIAVVVFIIGVVFILTRKEKFEYASNYQKTCPTGLNHKNVGKIMGGGVKPAISPAAFILKKVMYDNVGACFVGSPDICWLDPNISNDYKGIGAGQIPFGKPTTNDIITCYCGDCNVPQ